MAVIAVTTIKFGQGEKGEKVYNIGDTVSGEEDQLRSLVESGAAIETGKERKYSVAPTAVVSDEDTQKRDELLAKALYAQQNTDEPYVESPAVEGAAGAPGVVEETERLKAEQQSKNKDK